ncbi:MAG: dTDP-4-amino-4,6-dideoxygalactose transaminase [Chitinophagales bacterium]|nr:MAG: dTDP-4-amino-4,6-dideoxygalactose transaminase [Chitinophagales bacterium]
MNRHIPFSKITRLGPSAEFFPPDFSYEEKRYNAASAAILEKLYFPARVFLTKSCTHALELSALVAELKPGDEVILPSYGFVAIANAVVARGARCIFTDIRKDTLNLDEQSIEQAITPRTRMVITMNYAGVACEYDAIIELKNKYGFVLVEDNAQGIGAFYKEKLLGSFGDLSAISFDSLKNVSCGQGGCLIVNDNRFYASLRIAYEFGTNRMDFFENKTDKYEWKALGSNYALSEYLAAFLYPQLQQIDSINRVFLTHWESYYQAFLPLAERGLLDLPSIPPYCRHNGHLFHIRLKNPADRTRMIDFLRKKGVTAQFHYTPLHLSDYGKQHAEFRGNDHNTLYESSRLIRLPLFYSLSEHERQYIIDSVYAFFGIKP